MNKDIITYTQDEILERIQENKKNTGISVSKLEVDTNIKVQGKVSRGVNIEFNVICTLDGVTDEDVILTLEKIKILGLPLSKNMVMKYLESNFKTNIAKFKKPNIYVSKLAISKKIPELRDIYIEDIYIDNKAINIKARGKEQYSIG